ncbi:hypothetical protein FGRA07_11118 [Fusarium graminearum]|nr:hypothetical protein FGRA07_11118 [Fusarium graminearum]
MSSPSPQNVEPCIPAAIEWEVNQKQHHIAEPDPPSHSITFDMQFCAETRSALFKIYVPIYLKGFVSLSQICIIIDPSSLDSLIYTFDPTIPSAVRKKLNCTTVRLGFRLKPGRNLVIIAPTSANAPLAPIRVQSGKVLDAIRGKTIQLSGHQNNAPPPLYDNDNNDDRSQSALPNPKKRLRQNSQASSTHLIGSVLAELKELRIAYSLTLSDNAQLKKRLEAVESDVEQLQGETHHTSMKLESVDDTVLELDENLEGLTERVEAIEESNHDSDNKAILKDEIIDEIATRLCAH